VPSTLNLGWRHRLSSAALLVGIGGLATRRIRVAVGGAVAFVALNSSFYKLVAHKRGPRQAVVAVALHAAHHLAGMAAVPLGVIRFLSEDREDGTTHDESGITPSD
jgi:hypothetical protein